MLFSAQISKLSMSMITILLYLGSLLHWIFYFSPQIHPKFRIQFLIANHITKPVNGPGNRSGVSEEPSLPARTYIYCMVKEEEKNRRVEKTWRSPDTNLQVEMGNGLPFFLIVEVSCFWYLRNNLGLFQLLAVSAGTCESDSDVTSDTYKSICCRSRNSK